MVKITGGRWRGQKLTIPKGSKARPTSEKVRQAVFNVLENLVSWEGTRLYDLYAGSGAYGMEALSRGALHAVFVEAHPKDAQAIRASLTRLEPSRERWEVIPGKVESWLARNPILPPAVVLVDPPYALYGDSGYLAGLFEPGKLPPESILVAEAPHGSENTLPEHLELLASKRYGDTIVWFLTPRSFADGS
ncbi:MAG: 16S rRNA (guanine(966)-N(2))-methyltransferase RsmD [Deltaproteobacteria bacterium]|nr:16S rRNA (guanine(966)-N(2))-methyltransferase RsmD [Deltaproteobacteria bacterium]